MTLSRLAKNRDKQSNFQSIHVPLSYLSLSYSYSNSDMLSVSLHYIPYPSLSVSTSTFICSLCPISYCLFHTFLPLSSILKHFSILQLSHSLSFSCFYPFSIHCLSLTLRTGSLLFYVYPSYSFIISFSYIYFNQTTFFSFFRFFLRSLPCRLLLSVTISNYFINHILFVVQSISHCLSYILSVYLCVYFSVPFISFCSRPSPSLCKSI